VLAQKEKTLLTYPKKGVTKETLSVDRRIPCSINQLWFDLWNEVFFTFYSDKGKNSLKLIAVRKMNETGKKVDSIRKMKNDFAQQLYIDKEQ